MAHWEQRFFVNKLRIIYPWYFKGQRVLEIGSLNVNGTLRDFFEDCEYCGIDVDKGPGVDIVCGGQDYKAPNNSYDVVCSSECFEHNPFWGETFKNMLRLCRGKGFVFFTCATTGRPEHGTSRTTPADSPLTVGIGWEYYRNLTQEDFLKIVNFDDYFINYGFEVNNQSNDLYFWGIKKEPPMYS